MNGRCTHLDRIHDVVFELQGVTPGRVTAIIVNERLGF